MYIDIFFVVFLLIGLIQGFSRGILRTLFAILSIVVGFLAALKFSPWVIAFFDQVFDWQPTLSLIFGFLLTFILIMWGIRWLGKGIEKSLAAIRLNIVNKLFGAVLYAGLMALIYASIIWLIDRTEVLPEEQKESSVTYPFIRQVPETADNLFQSVKPVFKGFWEQLEDAIEGKDAEE